jgi:methylase of polypeptide subunit release factors
MNPGSPSTAAHLGVTILRRLASETPRWLRPGGWFVCEVGLGQGPTVARLLARNSEFDDVETVMTAASEVRVVAARRSVTHPSTQVHDPSSEGVPDERTTR